MIRNLRNIHTKSNFCCLKIQKRNFLTNDYKCSEAWNARKSTPMLQKVNLSDFYNILDQNYSSKGIVSAIDVDLFANAINDPGYLEELKDLLNKLRLSAETGNTLDSTHYATIRNYIEFDHIPELVDILKNPLNYGMFLDNYTANILLDKLITSHDYETAAKVASLIMLQEDFSNEITCALCQYACFKHIMMFNPKDTEPQPDEKPKNIEEVKIRVKFLRNPYYDDHFDISDLYILSGKTLVWISEKLSDNINNNLQIIGWLAYKKFDKLLMLCEKFAKAPSSKIYSEVIDILKKECHSADIELKPALENCLALLNTVSQAETSLEKSLEIVIENAINKTQNKDILMQQQLFQSWEKIREAKLEEQTKRLDRVKRMKAIEENQKSLEEKEQKLWFFENEENIDLEIEEKEKLEDKSLTKKSISKKNDENYIPPEIVPKRR